LIKYFIDYLSFQSEEADFILQDGVNQKIDSQNEFPSPLKNVKKGVVINLVNNNNSGNKKSSFGNNANKVIVSENLRNLQG
jgi:hypothetical protein